MLALVLDVEAVIVWLEGDTEDADEDGGIGPPGLVETFVRPEVGTRLTEELAPDPPDPPDTALEVETGLAEGGAPEAPLEAETGLPEVVITEPFLEVEGPPGIVDAPEVKDLGADVNVTEPEELEIG